MPANVKRRIVPRRDDYSDIIQVPYESHIGAILGGQFQLGRVINEDGGSGEKVYTVTALLAPDEVYEARSYSLQSLPEKLLATRKRHMKRLRARSVCEIDQAGEKFLVYRHSLTSETCEGKMRKPKFGNLSRHMKLDEHAKGVLENSNVPTAFGHLQKRKNPVTDIHVDETQTKQVLTTFRDRSAENLNASENQQTPFSLNRKVKRRRRRKGKKKMNPALSTRRSISDYQDILFSAVKDGNEEAVKLLFSDIHPGMIGYTLEVAFKWAVQAGQVDVVQLLLENGADIESRDNIKTPLSYAAQAGHLAVVELLLEKGADIESRNNSQTPLSYAAKAGQVEVVELLLEKGADIESRDNSQTPLSYAAEAGQVAVIEMLVYSGANTKRRDKYGRTPRWYAAKRGYGAIVRLLKSYDAQSPS